MEHLGSAFDDAALQIKDDFIEEVMQDRSLNKIRLTQSQLSELAHIILAKAKYEAEEDLKKGAVIPKKEKYLLDKCKDYLYAIKRQLVKFLIDEPIYYQIKGYRIFMIIGAGFSAEGGVPLAKHLDKMLTCKDRKEFKIG
jgi:hypothetical protein